MTGHQTGHDENGDLNLLIWCKHIEKEGVKKKEWEEETYLFGFRLLLICVRKRFLLLLQCGFGEKLFKLACVNDIWLFKRIPQCVITGKEIHQPYDCRKSMQRYVIFQTPLEQQFVTEKGRIIKSRLGTTRNTKASCSLPAVNNAFLLLKTSIQRLFKLFEMRRNVFAKSEYKKAKLREFHRKDKKTKNKTKQICPTCVKET